MADLSIIIGFKDWGVERIAGAIKSLQGATDGLDAEIIIADYGSETPVRSQVEELGARYIYTQTTEPWSRSRALNSGLEAASGSVLVTTDADMVFSPGTFKIVLERLKEDPQQFALMQCRDLPAGITHADVNDGTVSWEQLQRKSTYRPRWGMGGMIAVPRWAYERLRGLDERMVIYGGEDIDFAKRMKRLGLRMTWIEDPNALMFHVWHPSSRNAADGTPEGRKAIATNRAIHLNDKSSIRNLNSWRHAPAGKKPLVSIVVSTLNRADYLSDCIYSVLSQTMPDWELLIVDDGSRDHTKQVVAAFDDPRIKYHYQENAGLAAARNWGTDLAQGQYIAVHDDDDIMLPDRLEVSLSAVTEGAVGAYGGWVDFDENTGARSFKTGKRLSLSSLLFNSGIYLHPTLLIETRVLKQVRYDPTFRSGSDYNLAIRLQRAGIKLNHCGRYVTLRRQHDGQITALDNHLQKTTGALSAVFGRSNMSWADAKTARLDRAERDKVAIQAQKTVEPYILRFLPDKTVKRTAIVELNETIKPTEATNSILRNRASSSLITQDGREIRRKTRIDDLKLHDLFTLISDRACEIKVETETLHTDAAMTIAPYTRLSEADLTFDMDGLVHAHVTSMMQSHNGASFSAVYTDQLRVTLNTLTNVTKLNIVDVLEHSGSVPERSPACVILKHDSVDMAAELWQALKRSPHAKTRISTYRIEAAK